MLAITALGLSPAIAAANGAKTIDAAPNLVLNATTSSGWSSQVVFGTTEGEFWRVPLIGGQTLTITTSDVSGQGACGLTLDMYTPSVTESIVASAPIASSGTGQITFTAPYTGTWTLLVTTGCGGSSTVSFNYIAAVEPAKGEARTGAATIAAAPDLGLNATVSTGWSSQVVFGTTEGEFWRVPLTGGQTLTIATSGVSGQGACGLELDMYAPSVTDSTVATTAKAWSGIGQITFTAPYTGVWTLLVRTGCGGSSTVSFNYIAAVEPAKGEARTGAATIAAAPDLLFGATVASGWSHQVVFGTTEGEFWRVPLIGGQTLTIATSGVSGQGACGLELDMYAPSVTDSTVATATKATSGVGQITFTAPSTGTWTLLVTTGCGSSGTVSFNYIASISGPVTASTSTSHSTSASLSLTPHISYTVTSSGHLTIVVICSGSPCSGTLHLTAHTKKTTGRGKHRKTKTTSVTIGVASFSGLSIGTHSLSLKLNSTGLRLLKQNHDRLNATAQVTYTSGSVTETVRSNVSLKGTGPGKSKGTSKRHAPVG